jgi:hypothetical protein
VYQTSSNFTTDTAHAFNVTEHRSAPASVELINATKGVQSMLERVHTDRDECATVAGNGAHHDLARESGSNGRQTSALHSAARASAAGDRFCAGGRTELWCPRASARRLRWTLQCTRCLPWGEMDCGPFRRAAAAAAAATAGVAGGRAAADAAGRAAAVLAAAAAAIAVCVGWSSQSPRSGMAPRQPSAPVAAAGQRLGLEHIGDGLG